MVKITANILTKNPKKKNPQINLEAVTLSLASISRIILFYKYIL